jgi:paraquat-inducible protein A
MGLVTTVLGGLYMKNPPKFLPRIFGWVERLRPWSMIEVFLLGSFVAYSRLQVIAEVDVGPALIAFGGVMLCMVAADVELDHEAVWEALEARGLMQASEPDLSHPLIGCDCCRLVTNLPPGRRCPRCHRKLWRRKPRSLAQTYAFLVAATSLYLPANIYPIMTVLRFAQGEPSTILGGVAELIEYGMYPLALLVFLASIMVPVLKLAALATMLITTQLGSVAQLRQRTQLYRFIEFIGRWSMIDVFMITILVALVRLGYVATVLPGIGAIAFASVVVLTMLASASFDPRLMWDAAIAAGHDLGSEWVQKRDEKTA